MDMKELRAFAKTHQIDFTGMAKKEIIHTLQREEGNFECFGTAYDGVCDQEACLWREDCLGFSRE